MKNSGESISVAISADFAADSDPRVAAKAGHLHYTTDTSPGIHRSRLKDGSFRYSNPDGTIVSERETLDRIRGLAIPPSYTDVWISPIPNGHLQATGRDARGRKQYRYHAHWRRVREGNKYDRMLAFGGALPNIRAQVDTDLRRHGVPREKVVATIVRLLEKTRIRVGNQEYARTNNSFGLTTLRNDHVDVKGNTLHFHFRGKSGKLHKIELHDPRAARVVNQCLELPGQELFQYTDGAGQTHRVTSGDINEYLKSASGGNDFTAKDFRTWAGTVLCALFLASCEAPRSEAQAKRSIAEAIKTVSEKLGNTPAICRKCYVNPAVLESFIDGTVTDKLSVGIDKMGGLSSSVEGLSSGEAAVLRFLKNRSNSKS